MAKYLAVIICGLTLGSACASERPEDALPEPLSASTVESPSSTDKSTTTTIEPTTTTIETTITTSEPTTTTVSQAQKDMQLVRALGLEDYNAGTESDPYWETKVALRLPLNSYSTQGGKCYPSRFADYELSNDVGESLPSLINPDKSVAVNFLLDSAKYDTGKSICRVPISLKGRFQKMTDPLILSNVKHQASVSLEDLFYFNDTGRIKLVDVFDTGLRYPEVQPTAMTSDKTLPSFSVVNVPE